MLSYTIRRILWIIPVLIFTTFIQYVMLDMAPGTVADSWITDEMTQEEIDAIYRSLDLDKSAVWRYGKFLYGLIQGDLGKSMVSGEPVWEIYMSRWPATLKLTLWSLLLGITLGISLGMLAAKFAGTILDTLTTAFSLIGLSMPGFWLALLLMRWFSLEMRIFPPIYDGTWKSYVLPVIASGFSMSATLCRQTRSAILEVVRQDYLRTARAKGVPERRVTFRHTLRNAWIPIVTVAGMMLGITFAGSAIIETIFTWPGVGTLMIQALQRRDITMSVGCVTLTTTVVLVLILLVDLMYAVVDPRIRARFARKISKKGRVDA